MKRAILAVLLLTGCATVKMDPTEVAIPQQQTAQHFGLLGQLRVPFGEPLVLSTVDGEKAYCSTEPVAFNPGEKRFACFFDDNGSGYFDKWYMTGTVKTDLSMFSTHIPYSVMSMAEYQDKIRQHRAAR